MLMRARFRLSLPFVLSLCLASMAALAAVSCGGPNEADIETITGQPPDTGATPVALSERTDVSRISFQAGTQDIELEMFDLNGFCIINATTSIIALAGDFEGRPVPAGTPIAFFLERGRGLLDRDVLTDDAGEAEVTFHSLCPSNAADLITIVAAVRGSEPFTDLNSNGRWDKDEPFVDLPREAFLDANHNGVYEPELDEYLIWDANHNRLFDPGGNGRYDVDNIITATAVIIPVQQSEPTPTPDTGG
jgi:hypothetical protein